MHFSESGGGLNAEVGLGHGLIVEIALVGVIEVVVASAVPVVRSGSNGAEESPRVEDVTASNSVSLADNGFSETNSELINDSGKHIDSNSLGFNGSIDPSLSEVNWIEFGQESSARGN